MTDQTAAIEVWARMLCAASAHVYGDHPTWQQLSDGRRAEYRTAARWLLPRLTVQARPASAGVAPATDQTPCGPAPDQCDAEAGEPCANHEREQAHTEGEHAFCGPECGAVAATDQADQTHGLTVQHADALWDAVVIPGPDTPTFPVQHERVCRAVAEILDELAPAAVPAVDQTALRQQAIDALLEVRRPGLGAMTEADAVAYMADAVLAVLPDTSRAAAARWAADFADDVAEKLRAHHEFERSNGALDVMAELRRVAGGEQHTNTQTLPARGDQVEQWLKGQRDEYEVRSSPQWGALDEVLDTYRLHADTGTPLDQHACEGQHCDCPAASAAPAAPDTEA